MTFKIVLEPSGHAFSVENGEKLMTAALDQGVRIPMGCRMGTCRSCRGKIVSGQYDLGAAHPAYLPQADRNEGYALLCQATAQSDLVVEIDEVPFLVETRTVPALIKEILRVTDDTIILILRLPLHENLTFAAGQYIDFILNEGTRRSYSIANASRAQGVIDLELHVRHMPGGVFTDWLFHHAKIRDRLTFEGPLGGFYLRESDRPALFLATGTGYAPVRSIILTELASGSRRPMTIYWGTRTLEDMYLHEEARELAAKHPNLTFIPVVSRQQPSPESGWTGATGHVQNIAASDIPDMSEWQVYACGSPAMVDAALPFLAAQCGLSEKNYFADAFTSMADSAPPQKS